MIKRSLFSASFLQGATSPRDFHFTFILHGDPHCKYFSCHVLWAFSRSYCRFVLLRAELCSASPVAQNVPAFGDRVFFKDNKGKRRLSEWILIPYNWCA